MRALRLAIPALIIATIIGCSSDVTKPEEALGPATTFEGPPASGCSTVNPKTVLVDASYDGGVWWFPQTAFFSSGQPHQGKAFADYLRSKGYIVTELGRGQRMAPDSMMKYAVIVRAGYYYNDRDARYPRYTEADLGAYEAYAGCTRTLVMLADYLRDGEKDHLADRFAIPLVGILNGKIDTFTPHALTAGVTELPYIAGSYLASESNPSIQVLGRVGTLAVMGLLTGRPGKVFFIGDTNGIEMMPQPFVDNLLVWGF